MRKYIRTARPERNFSTPHTADRFAAPPRPLNRKNIAVRTAQSSTESFHAAPPVPFQLDPYLDYGRFLTAEGGILIIYKDIDVHWRHTIWRLLAWIAFTGFEFHYLFSLTSTQNPWLTWGLLLAAAFLNWLIVAKPVELYRRIEIRPDCMIIDGGDVFWTRFIEGGLPSCRLDAAGNQVFCGIYGTRFVEYLTIRRFDENDRMTEVMTAHLLDAMRQLWMVPH